MTVSSSPHPPPPSSRPGCLGRLGALGLSIAVALVLFGLAVLVIAALTL